MDRRHYIYWATPLFILLSCGQAMVAMLGATGALIAGGAAAAAAWGVVWLRLYRQRRLRPEFAVLSILPQVIYLVDCKLEHPLAEEGPMWQNLYALTWIAAAAVLIASVRPAAGDTASAVLPRLTADPIFLLMTPLICLYSGATFVQYYTSLFTI